MAGGSSDPATSRIRGLLGPRRKIGRRAGAIAVGLFAFAMALAVRNAIPEVSTLAANLTFDAYQRLSPRPYGDAPVRVVDIDEASLAAFGQWPWPRTRIAAMVERLARLGAAAIAFDILFAEPDQTSPLKVVASAAGRVGAGSRAADADRRPTSGPRSSLCQRAGGRPAVLGFALSPTPNERRPISNRASFTREQIPAAILPPFAGAVPPIPVLEGAASGIGSVSLSRNDTSGVVRRVPMLFSDGERTYPSLVVEALRVAQGASSIIVRSTGASGEKDVGVPALVELKVGEFRAPLTARRRDVAPLRPGTAGALLVRARVARARRR